jgi:hypothetical protein
MLPIPPSSSLASVDLSVICPSSADFPDSETHDGFDQSFTLASQRFATLVVLLDSDSHCPSPLESSPLTHQPAPTSLESSAISYQPSAISYQPSAISYQPSAISYQPSAISYQLSAISPQPAPTSLESSAISYQPSAISYQPSAISYQLSAISPQPAPTSLESSAISYQPSAISYQLSAISPQPARTSLESSPSTQQPSALSSQLDQPPPPSIKSNSVSPSEPPSPAPLPSVNSPRSVEAPRAQEPPPRPLVQTTVTQTPAVTPASAAHVPASTPLSSTASQFNTAPTTSSTPTTFNGTGAANQTGSLKNTPGTKHFSQLHTQFLPVTEPASLQSSFGGTPKPPAVPTPPLAPPSPLPSATSGLPVDAAVQQSIPASSGSDFTGELRLPQLPAQIDRLTLLLNREVAFIRKNTLSSLSVVIRPDAGTELSVQFRRSNGTIEVRIRCDRGPQEPLQRHWPELQSLFAEKAIRLLPLEDARITPLDRTTTTHLDTATQGDKRQSSNLPDPGEHTPHWANTPGNSTPDPSTREPVHTPHHGWQTWA